MKIFLNLHQCWLLALVTIIYSCNSGEANGTGSAAKEGQPVNEYIFGEEHPLPESHASTIIKLNDGQYLTAWFSGTKEKHDDVGIWMAKGNVGKWEKPYEVVKMNNEAHWNPVLFKSKNGKIYLYYKVGKEISHWKTWLKTSDDEGKTWSAPTELVPGDVGGRGPVRNKLIELSDGSWLAGASNENGPWNVFMDRSEDGGKTWTATPYLKFDTTEIKGKGIIQPTLWESAPGQVHALLRSTGGAICRSDSKDFGKTWSPVYKTNLPNPNSGIDLVKFDDGALLLIYNPDSKNWGSRGTISAALSTDNGQTWSKRIDIEKSDAKDEFSYPAIINDGDTVALTYTWNRKKISFWTATREWINEQVKNNP